MEIHLYEHNKYTGREVPLTKADPNLDNVHFSNKTSSIIITSGKWQLFDRPNYGEGGAGAVVLGPGHYPDAKSIGLPNNSISSLRPFPELHALTKKRPNLEKIFSKSDSDLCIFSQYIGGPKLGTSRYVIYSSDEVSVKGELDYDGHGSHLHGPFNLGLKINDSDTCTFTYEMGDFNISHSFPIKTRSEKDFDIIIDDYTVGGKTYNGRINVAHVISGKGAKISPNIEVSPGSEHFTHGIIIKPC
jgi:hypothetical protein